ncbi:MAG: 4-(cytidine 5'-diphospho)-2-C-methyl-D-erythritol kinase [Deltaproteobacteria bacterium]|nr:4-(cytidine 5'-diphospho)-2-C-methyl-D-erythritol kinase [Deltaproteobacteria bacterium]
MVIVKEAPAKINLVLRVMRRREDGYHDIVSLLQRITLADEMIFEARPRGITVRCDHPRVPEDENNIVHRALNALFEKVSHKGGIDVAIRKKIPVAAGLGGGSSNAAAALVTANELLSLGLTRGELMNLGGTVGADVPFFVFEKTAWARGIGDRLEEARGMPSLSLLLVNPGFEVSTKSVYEGLKRGLTKDRRQYNIPALTTVPRVVEELHNDLESVSVVRHPVLADIKEALIGAGALGALMSGSGPTVFGIFKGSDDVARAEQRLKVLGLGATYRASSL